MNMNFSKNCRRTNSPALSQVTGHSATSILAGRCQRLKSTERLLIGLLIITLAVPYPVDKIIDAEECEESTEKDPK
jgi:hypothetical protein